MGKSLKICSVRRNSGKTFTSSVAKALSAAQKQKALLVVYSHCGPIPRRTRTRLFWRRAEARPEPSRVSLGEAYTYTFGPGLRPTFVRCRRPSVARHGHAARIKACRSWRNAGLRATSPRRGLPVAAVTVARSGPTKRCNGRESSRFPLAEGGFFAPVNLGCWAAGVSWPRSVRSLKNRVLVARWLNVP